ncbi:hypothetical protein BH23ACT5_BH23ACT5_06290 [soil metagenome]
MFGDHGLRPERPGEAIGCPPRHGPARSATFLWRGIDHQGPSCLLSGFTERILRTEPRLPDEYTGRDHLWSWSTAHLTTATLRSDGASLEDRFTCYLPSLRGRGLSEYSQDHSPPRLEEDVRAFVDSIGEPVCLLGWSAGVPWTLATAADSGAVVAYEPTIIPVMRGDDAANRDTMYQKFGAAAADGRSADAARAFPLFRLHRERDGRPGRGLLRAMRSRCSGSASSWSARRGPMRGPCRLTQ